MSQFGGSPRDQDYGYFGSQKPAASTSTFGAPAPTGVGYGAPSAHTRPPGAKSGVGKKALLVMVVLGLVALRFGWYGWETYQSNKAIVIPSTLAGYPASDNSELQALLTDAERELRVENDGSKLEAAGYGDKKHITLLFVLRGQVDVDREFADFESSFGEQVGVPTTIGASTCAENHKQAVAYCIHSSRTLTVEVVSIAGSSKEAASAVDEAWALQ